MVDPTPLRRSGPNDEVHAHTHEWDENGCCRFCPVEKPAMDALAALITAIEGQEKALSVPGAGSKGLKAAADFEQTYRRLTDG